MPSANYSFFNSLENSSISYASLNNNFSELKPSSRLEKEAIALFGGMRDASLEEQSSVNKYIVSISKKTGVNFFDLC